MAEFTDEQVGKRVVAQNGAEIGTVESVRDGTIYVTVAAEVDADVCNELGWGGTVNDQVEELAGEFVSTVTDGTIRLRV